jgi:Adenylate and Guanylate cyclase catalytic domain
LPLGRERQLESQRREITALFCDLRGFTGFTESADAEDVMALLRDYHAAIGEIIISKNNYGITLPPLLALSRPKSSWPRSGRIRFECKRLGQGKSLAAVMSVR